MVIDTPAPADTQATLVFDSRCRLGESIVWCDRQRVLWWTDIEGRRIWRQGPVETSGSWWLTPGRVGSLALCASGRVLLGMEDGLYLADPALQPLGAELECRRLCDVPMAHARMRINDGRVDRAGNFVFGTLNESPGRERVAHFYQYSPHRGLRRLALDAVAIANGICFSPDGRSMYYCDSLQGRIMRAAYDAVSAHVHSPHAFAEVGSGGEPDGATVDAQGRVWSAQWGAARVICYAPDGREHTVLQVPALQPSCVSFAGEGSDALYISSARIGLGEAQLQADPDNGGVFHATVQARGLAECRFADT